MGPTADSDRIPIMGYEPIHRVAQSYLGSLWIAVRAGGGGEPSLLRRLQLPEDTSAAARELILQAGRAARELHDERVLAVTAVLEDGATVAMVYDHFEAEPLRSLQSWANLRGVAFPVSITLRIMTDLLRGLAALHQRFGSGATPVFGGLSPDSVLVSRSGGTRLADPLVASCASLLEPLGFNTSKLAYAAPEQVHAVAALTPQCDLFTCGVMLWELIATRRFLSGSRAAIERKLLEHNLPSLAANMRGDQRVSPELVAVVESALASDLAKRPASALVLADQLARAGHEVASSEEVAQFIGKLSGQRFDRRTAAVRSRSIPNLDAPAELPAELPTRQGARRGLQGKSSGDHPIDAPRETEPTVPEPDLFDSRPDAAARRGTAAEGPGQRGAAPNAPMTRTLRMAPAAAGMPAFPPAPLSAAAAGAPPMREAPRLAAAPAAPMAPAPIATAASPGSPIAEPPPLTPPAPATPGVAPAGAAAATPVAAITPARLLSPAAARGAALPERERPVTAPAAPVLHEPVAPPGKPAAATSPERWDTVIAPALSSPAIAAQPATRGRTMTGLGQPVHPALAPSVPFANMTPAPFHLTRPGAGTAGPPTPSVSQAAATSSGAAPRARGAAPASMPAPAPAIGALEAASTRQDSAPSTLSGAVSWARGWIPARAIQRLAWAALFLLTFGVSSILFVLFLARGTGSRTSVDATPAATSEADIAENARAAPSADEDPRSIPPPEQPAAGRSTPAAPGGSAAPQAASAAAKPALAPPVGNFDGPVLDDQQLVELFALEQRMELPTCAARLGASAADYGGNDPRQSVLQLKAARRELMRGKPEQAHTFLCGAVAHDPRNVPAQQALAELALQLGDPAQAKVAVERALEREPHNATLSALLGDVQAMLGDLATSRSLWLASFPGKGSPEERTRRLASSYRVLGDRALRASSFAQARNLYRRSVILGAGAFAPTVGLGEALLWLGHRRAALAWVERVARAFPKDSRIQLLYGDALYDNEQPDKARAAWQAALDAQPENVTAARRLAQGRR